MNVEAFINLQFTISSGNSTFRTAKLSLFFYYARVNELYFCILDKNLPENETSPHGKKLYSIFLLLIDLLF